LLLAGFQKAAFSPSHCFVFSALAHTHSSHKHNFRPTKMKRESNTESPRALSNFMANLFAKKCHQGTNTIEIVQDNAKRRTSSRNLKLRRHSSKRLSFRASQRWKSNRGSKASLAISSDPCINCPQRRKSIERRGSSGEIFVSSSVNTNVAAIPSYDTALQMVQKKYAQSLPGTKPEPGNSTAGFPGGRHRKHDFTGEPQCAKN
jgi:hypothetical protein